MKRNFILLILIGIVAISSNIVFAQWTMTTLPNPPGGHGALPGRVTAMEAGGSNVWAGTLGGNIYLSQDNGGSWTHIDSGLTTSDINIIKFNNNTLYVGTYGSGIFMTTDNGQSWKSAGASLTNPYIYSLAFVDSTILAASWGGGVFASNDNGATWNHENNGLTNLFVRTLAVKDKRIYAGTWGDGIFLSDDDGASWTKSNNGINKLFIYTIEPDGPNVYFGNDEGVYFSNNNGFYWNLINSGLTNTYIRAIVVIDPNLLVGTSGQGVFVSTNMGNLWASADTGLSDGFIYCLATNASKIFAGSLNGEIWSRSISEVITAVNKYTSSSRVEEFMLYQNYPNPFNPSTKINYRLAKNEFVTLKIYDALGREVETLVNGNQNAGNYSVEFNGSNLSSGRAGLTSGIYFYRLKAGSYTSVKKMILMK